MKNIKIILSTVVCLLVFGACEPEETTPQQMVSIQEDLFDTTGTITPQALAIDDRIALTTNEQLPSLADILLANGNTLHFYAQEEDVSGVLVLEEGACSGCSALADIEAAVGKEVNARDIFWAISTSGTAVPAILDELYPVAKTRQPAQGWMRDQLTTSVSGVQSKAADVACNNASFQSSIAGGFLGSPEYVRLDKRPNNYNAFKSDCYNVGLGQCWGNPRYKLIAKFSNIKKWRGKVCTKNVETNYNSHTILYCGNLCSVDPDCNQPGSCSIYQGPQVSFEYYWNGKWNIMKNGSKVALYEIQANKTKVYNWHWSTSQKTSFRLRIRYAKPYDQFDLMMDK